MIIRVTKDKRMSEGYSSVLNAPFADSRLHWETRGLLAYLFTKPNHWQIRLADLIAQGTAKEHKVRKMLREAQKYGYINRIRIQKDDGLFIWMSEVYENPEDNPTPQTSGRFSTRGSSTCGSSTRGKPRDIVITELEITDTPLNIFALYEANIGALTPMLADKLKDAEQTYAPSWISEAIDLAVTNNKRSWAYCETILKRWQTEGKDSGKGNGKDSKKKSADKAPAESYLAKVASNVFNS